MKRTAMFLTARLLVPVIIVLAATHVLDAQEKSVRPGINKAFKDPDLKRFIGLFEREGRDAFDHRHEIVKATGLKPGMAVADIGAGTGLFTRLFSPAVGAAGRVYSVDISKKFVKHVEKTAREKGLTNITGVVCRPDAVNLPEASIDVAFICDTYHHFEFPHNTMRSIRRALKPGGKVVLIDFERIEGKTSKWVMGHVRAGQKVFTAEILKAGFRQVDEKKGMLSESYFVRFEKDPSANESKRKKSVALFDGKTLDGWMIRGGFAKYTVKENMIVGTTSAGSPNTFLCKGPFSDFVLEFDVRCDKQLNSGVQIRSHVYQKDTPRPGNPKHIQKKGSVYGYQCEIARAEGGTSGNFWDEARRGKWLDDFSNKPKARKAFKAEQWNHYRIIAKGDHIRSWINGVACADFHDKTDAGGFIGLQIHGIRKGTGPYSVRWRNIRIQELKPGK